MSLLLLFDVNVVATGEFRDFMLVSAKEFHENSTF